MAAEPARCPWAAGSPLEQAYHDREWGVPSRDDRHLFEMLILEGAQAGLSWSTILNKRAAYRVAYAGFDPERVAAFSDRDQARLLQNPGIVRNRLKVAAARDNARAFLEVQAEVGAFADYLWGFVGDRVIQNRWRRQGQVPAQTAESDALSKALRKRGFRFVGPTICYALMQSVGMVNDHVTGCFRHAELAGRS